MVLFLFVTFTRMMSMVLVLRGFGPVIGNWYEI